MTIMFNQERRMFHIQNKYYSYIMTIEENNILSLNYYGAKIRNLSYIRDYPRIDRSFSPNMHNSENRLFSLDTLPQEFSSFGSGDFREPAFIFRSKDGSSINDFRYKSHTITSGKKPLKGLPQTNGKEKECETLEITIEDTLAQLEIVLKYTTFENYAVLVKSSEVVNHSLDNMKIEKIMSMSLDLPNADYELIHLNGTWARETQLTRETIQPGIKLIDSKRGASSHQQNPFFAILDSNTNENHGEVYGFSLVYSGNFAAEIQNDAYNQLRLNFGINPFQFTWNLAAGESFQTPEVVMVYSGNGLNGMSQQYHSFYRNHLLRGKNQNLERPILINNWEATYFDYDEDSLLEIVDEASTLGIELFVLDDGWFGTRNSDKESLGDWVVNKNKFPNGINSFSEKVKSKHMKFGIWVEPEMISKKSDLYHQHPDWCLQVEGRGKSLGRSQYVLDFSRADVRDHIEATLTAVFTQSQVDYVKWDMNRHITEAFSIKYTNEQQGEIYHRYMLGLYDLLERLVSKFPSVLFEGCSGGGGRFDPGMLYYMPQTWTSDNTDPISRLSIQYGTSLVYPIITMGAHVSSSPNHQVGRETSLKMRGDTAMAGNLGYELNVLNIKEEEKRQIAEQVKFYKKHRSLIQFGDFYRMLSPFDGNDCSWMFVSKDKSEALFFYYRILKQASEPLKIVKLYGLDTNKNYYFEGEETLVGGDELMNSGMYLPTDLDGDYTSYVRYLSILKT
ncbi:alpha-galactosidase [Carnobacterium iners]|uniref:Alpha-galactosidase n=1 Tax=Carnobacterium iners TaxID=1073423 RepID=A0A1X7MZK7_9LACT|nr:alpha-galactosidase [Carnobacterium iners]SEK19137.1 alpha-galactosidase [Carnobacterium iners]SMH29943.1 alpha-galactosidase [Carnobacterium iners]